MGNDTRLAGRDISRGAGTGASSGRGARTGASSGRGARTGLSSGRGAGTGRRPARRFTGVVWLALVLAGALLVGLTLLPHQAPARPARVVVASLPYWNIKHGAATVLAYRKDFTEVSPWVYGLAADGQIVPQYPPGQAASVNAQIARLRAAGLRVVPTLANITAGRWSYQSVAQILHDPARMRQNVASIAALVRSHGYAGIDIDYENLRASDRQAFTRFIAELAAALHAEGKILSVALFAKTTNTGYDQRNVAQDYAALGRVADQVRIMAYDYHWGSSAPGPVAPIGWVRAVLRYAISQIPASKIILGVGLYGYDWSGGRGTALSWLRAFQLSNRYHAAAHYDTTSQAPWFTYTDAAGHRHVVWFENEASARAKFGAAQGSQIGGVFLWMFGYEDTGTWAALGHTLPVPGQPPTSAGGTP